jgi:hypothetical protein
LVLKDTSKPEGEACNADGTLKDAEQMQWLNSPLDLPPPSFKNQEKHGLGDGSDDDRVAKWHRVSSSTNS